MAGFGAYKAVGQVHSALQSWLPMTLIRVKMPFLREEIVGKTVLWCSGLKESSIKFQAISCVTLT